MRDIEYLISCDKRINSLSSIQALLEWDLETQLAEESCSERANQMGLLEEIIHKEAVDEKLREAVDRLKEDQSLDLIDKALVKHWDKFYKREANLPVSFVSKLTEVKSLSSVAWREAREKNDWSIFAPHLKELIELNKEMARIISPEKSTYDALLDLYEEGMETKLLDPLFSSLKCATHELLDKIENKKIDDSFLTFSYDKDKLHEYCVDLHKRMGFDYKRGVCAISAHPFTTSLGPDDVRLTTRYTDPSILDPISSMVHETGHALYELNTSINPRLKGTSVGRAVSMGIHESQSRFWENIIGKSYSFWKREYPLLQEKIVELKEISFDDFYKAANTITPSAIRVNADEVTYNLHIILRYEMEKAIFIDNYDVDKLPELWNKLSKEIIRYEVKSDSEGILQDVHWSGGMFGYFPTYSLGNLYSAMFRSSLVEHLGGEEALNSILESGNYDAITSWQRENIWVKGSIYSPSELVKMVTGNILDLNPFKEYLIKKYSQIYNL